MRGNFSITRGELSIMRGELSTMRGELSTMRGELSIMRELSNEGRIDHDLDHPPATRYK